MRYQNQPTTALDSPRLLQSAGDRRMQASESPRWANPLVSEHLNRLDWFPSNAGPRDPAAPSDLRDHGLLVIDEAAPPMMPPSIEFPATERINYWTPESDVA